MIIDLWPQILALIAIVAWAVRLESMAKYNEKTHLKDSKLIWKKINELEDESKNYGKSIAEIKGIMSNKD